MMSKKPLQLPSMVTPRTRVSFRQTDESLSITDRRRGIQIVLWSVAALFVATGIGGIFWLEYLGTLPNQHRLTDQVALGISLIALSVFALIVLPIVIAVKGLHRSFRVRVDTLRRTCVCTKRNFGVRIRRRELDASDARWDVDTVYVQHKATANHWNLSTVALGLILFLLGPVGWIIGILANFRRNTNPSNKWEGKAMVRLCLSKHDETIAFITVPNESIAQDFLIAWDHQFAKPTRAFG